MEPLRTSDPSSLAGHRLLGRLGAGGMGVVYLARSAGGALVALKVIQAEYAEDADFRERFRREAETARRMTSPWVASLVDADPEASQPWLATDFVPGPSLGEAVAAHGPLPVRGLRVLGARLAEALRDLHGVGLVHRDVKPGNVLLALDGPRLIDFGVARDPRDTGLTSTGVVVGTPGFLPPEQAGGGHEPGPAGDVFSLGCVLAHAAHGRPPFGTGSLDAMLYRTVHDAPDLDGVPRELAEVVRGCLEKDPRLRPTAEELSRTLTATPPAAPADPREALRADPRPAREEREPGDRAWLPEPLVRLIAERAAAGLALPAVDETEVDPGSAGTARDDTAGQPSDRAVGRRRLLVLAGGALAVAAGGGVAAWAALSGDGEGNGGTGAPTGPVHTIGLHADLSGDHRAVGRAQERGLRLAVEEFNSRTDRPFTLAVRAVDDGGDPAGAVAAAKRLVADPSVLAVIGPTTDDTALAALATYDAASLPLIAVSPGATVLTVTGSRSFLHARVTDTVLPFYLSAYLRGTAKSRTIGIVDDRAADAYAWEISSSLSRALRDARQPAVPKVVSALRTDFGPTLDALLDGGADSVVFAGYHDRAALLARELRHRGFPGARAAAQGVLDSRFLTAAGDAADGWVIVAPVMDASVAPEAKAFAAAYRKRFGTEPERYAAEAYDVARLTARSLSSSAAGRATRHDLTTALRGASYRGITKNFAFDRKTGALVIDGRGVYLWTAGGGRFRYQGAAPFRVST
ncbi:bifunctional serine/threonine-protein kinase/ABC transporter substrate-binding protein [Streptomyces sp. WI03-4A]|uniref:bifunctional serine/threonine-protein kinase/ABC transporter substrate-binding protein n=1 Tax=Streptomyces sp. WI03-4A TaxID=3028706 RepID=UPI0029A898E7|nr:bifunctional serine/threonine-protein kinase/ABC transporter substrate-binding protein [Streptomyces sp. WI03-4A]MDX2590811.1 bifunctional serine/threonine-protein kinase/ABC transporter substrate-binding protein [Streptomyces sp. WI03-4A]